jgi:hypothetical protein
VQTLTGQVEVEVPENGEDHDDVAEHESDAAPKYIGAEPSRPDYSDVRQSIQIQAQIAEIGAKWAFVSGFPRRTG